MKRTIRIESSVLPLKKEQFCNLIHEHHLHMGCQGLMEDWARHPDYAEVIAIAFDEHQPVGAAIYMKPRYGIGTIRYGVYVDPQYRRRRIGTMLTRIVIKRVGRQFLVSKHNYQAKEFYNSLHLRAGFC